MRQIVLDTETTGLSTAQGHRIIEIGAIELVNRRVTGREFHRFLNPERDIDEGAERVHGISRADLETAPRFSEVADELLEFIRDAELVIHNAEFDVGFLEYELGLMKHPRPSISDVERRVEAVRHERPAAARDRLEGADSDRHRRDECLASAVEPMHLAAAPRRNLVHDVALFNDHGAVLPCQFKQLLEFGLGNNRLPVNPLRVTISSTVKGS